jgi:hypothetical protein
MVLHEQFQGHKAAMEAAAAERDQELRKRRADRLRALHVVRDRCSDR